MRQSLKQSQTNYNIQRSSAVEYVRVFCKLWARGAVTPHVVSGECIPLNQYASPLLKDLYLHNSCMSENISRSHDAQIHMLHKLTFECLNYPMVHFQPRNSHVPALGLLSAVHSQRMYVELDNLWDPFSPHPRMQGRSGHKSSLRKSLVVHHFIAPDWHIFVEYKINRDVLE